MSIKEKAAQNFNNGLNCAQSVIEAYFREFNLDTGIVKAVSAGFGGGMGRAQKTCGAVSGGIMAIGLKYYDKDDLPGSKEKAYIKTRELLKRFEKKHGSSECRVLLGVDLNIDEGKKEYKEKDFSKKKCLEYIKDVCSILEDI